MRTALVCGMGLLLFLTPARADELSARLDEIFATVESPAGKHRADLEKQLTSLAPQPADDARLHQAYVVALMHVNKHKDALREVNLLVRSHPKHIQAQRLRACGIARDYRKGQKPSDHAPLLLELAD